MLRPVLREPVLLAFAALVRFVPFAFTLVFFEDLRELAERPDLLFVAIIPPGVKVEN